MFKFEQLEIWVEAKNYAGKIYKISKDFPRDEMYGLTDQLRRSAVSISANIAEGSGGNSKKDFSHFLDIAIKSLYETVSHLYIAKDQEYISEKVRMELYLEAEILIKRIKSFQSWINK